MKALFLLMSIFGAIAIVVADTQSPATSPVQQLAPDAESLPAALALLQAMKTTNEEVLKKQEATLQTLEDLQKAADEIKIFSKRG